MAGINRDWDDGVDANAEAAEYEGEVFRQRVDGALRRGAGGCLPTWIVGRSPVLRIIRVDIIRRPL
jgi:hypothetical protein